MIYVHHIEGPDGQWDTIPDDDDGTWEELQSDLPDLEDQLDALLDPSPGAPLPGPLERRITARDRNPHIHNLVRLELERCQNVARLEVLVAGDTVRIRDAWARAAYLTQRELGV